MMKKLFNILFVITVCLIINSSDNVKSAPGDTTWITACTDMFHNWPDVHYFNVNLPDTNTHYQQILMTYTIACPAAGCDPWDRLAWIKLYQDTANHIDYEIGRVITPYNIVGGGYPGTCTYVIDVTDYMPLLHDNVLLGSYIETWINGTRGWLVTLKFAYIEGEAYYKPVKVINLWQDHHVVYGDSINPPTNHITPQSIMIDAGTDVVKSRITTTGHGQGNTLNAAEFSPRIHSIVAGNDSVYHNLWRANCYANPCSPQGGTWTLSRAGWCPGASVVPWIVDLTQWVTPGQNQVFRYSMQEYINECSPNNPNCTTGVTCGDCNYNNNGHTEPHYTIEGQLILYKINPIGIKNPGTEIANGFSLMQNYPNPFNPKTNIKFSLEKGSHVKITVFDIRGKEIAVLIDKALMNGDYNVDFDASNFPSGVYYYQMEAKDFKDTKKMVLIK